MVNWCIWHFRFGQCRHSGFITSKVHALYFCKDPENRIWNPDTILEQSDRASIYGDARTMAKDTNKGMRVPMDVWYGKYWGRIQGNNKERRHNHQNQFRRSISSGSSCPVPTRTHWCSIPSGSGTACGGGRWVDGPSDRILARERGQRQNASTTSAWSARARASVSPPRSSNPGAARRRERQRRSQRSRGRRRTLPIRGGSHAGHAAPGWTDRRASRSRST